MSKTVASTIIMSTSLAATNSALSKRQASDPDPIRLLIISRVRHNRISVNPKLFLGGSTVYGAGEQPRILLTEERWNLRCTPAKNQKLHFLLLLLEKFETATKVVEHMTEIVEGAASKVEEVVEDAANQLPVGKTRDGAVFFENVAKEIEKDAHILEQALKKAEEVEKGVESFFQSLTQQENAVMTA